MPFERGSAAIEEWIEMIIYRYHQCELEYKSGISINMEALTLLMDKFIEKYASMIKLTPISDLEPPVCS